MEEAVNGRKNLCGIIQPFTQYEMVKSLKIIFKTGRKYRYEFMCAVDTHGKYNVSMTDDARSGVRRPMPITSSKEALFSLGHTISFIDN